MGYVIFKTIVFVIVLGLILPVCVNSTKSEVVTQALTSLGNLLRSIVGLSFLQRQVLPRL